MNKEVRNNLLRAKGLAMLVLSFCLCLGGFCFPAKAAQTVSVSVPVSMTASDVKDVSFTVRLLEQASGATASTLSLKHGQEKEFSLSFSAADVGAHTYTIRQLEGTNASISYDTTLYWLQVVVTEKGDGSLTATSILWKDGSSEKLAKVSFVNTLASGSGGSGEDNSGSGSGGTGSGSGEDNSGSGSGDATSGSGAGGSGSGDTNSSGSSSFWNSSSLWGSASSTTSSGSGVRTGDESCIGTYLIVLLLSAALILAALLVSRRTNLNNMDFHRKDRVHG